jgi:hypothetical protein
MQLAMMIESRVMMGTVGRREMGDLKKRERLMDKISRPGRTN